MLNIVFIRLPLKPRGRNGLLKHHPLKTGHPLNLKAAFHPRIGKTERELLYDPANDLCLPLWMYATVPGDQEQTLPHLVIKHLKTGWVMTSTLIRGNNLIVLSMIVEFFFVLFNKCITLFKLLFSGGGYSGNQENRYVGFGNTVTPEKKEDDFINNAMSSIYSVRHIVAFSLSVRDFHFLLFCRVGAISLLGPPSLLQLQKIM